MKIHEECGVFGVMAKEPANVAMMCYYGLYALQTEARRAAASSSMRMVSSTLTKTLDS